MDVVKYIEGVSKGRGDRPVEEVKIAKSGVVEGDASSVGGSHEEL